MSLSEKAAKAKKLQVKKTVLDWCKDQVKKGHELTLHWEGGGDSGWCHFQIDGKPVDNEYTDYLVNRMYDTLEYGSWAGEFSATGYAKFDSDTNAFEGIDEYCEQETGYKEVDDLKIYIPKSVWFDAVHITIDQGSADDSPEITLSLTVKNGFLSTKNDEVVSRLIEDLEDDVQNFIDNLDLKHHNYAGMYNDLTLTRSDFKENKTHYIAEISGLNYRFDDVDEKPIYLEISEEETI